MHLHPRWLHLKWALSLSLLWLLLLFIVLLPFFLQPHAILSSWLCCFWCSCRWCWNDVWPILEFVCSLQQQQRRLDSHAPKRAAPNRRILNGVLVGRRSGGSACERADSICELQWITYFYVNNSVPCLTIFCKQTRTCWGERERWKPLWLHWQCFSHRQLPRCKVLEPNECEY